jgi:sugar diacid utilization regulator/GAF domain-containing protein
MTRSDTSTRHRMTVLTAASSLAALVSSTPANVNEAMLLATQFLRRSRGDQGWEIEASERESSNNEVAHSGFIVRSANGPFSGFEDVRGVCDWLRLIGERDQYRAALEATAAESESQFGVADEILSIRDLDQVLLSIVNRTLVLLDSDICGVLLRDADVINMKACVGHRVVETANLRMERGQGLAGLVFASGQHGRVDSYVDDHTISPDFIPLAEQEETRSALAVPLLAHGDVIGVLEVWRRRASVFTESDVRRMLALGALASIAIENARLYDLQALTLGRLSAAHEALEHHVAQLDRSARLQAALLRIVLDHGGAADRIMRTVADEYGCVAVLTRESGRVEAAYPAIDEDDATAVPVRGSRGRVSRSPVRHELPDGRRVWSQSVVVGDLDVGTVNLVGGTDTDEAMRTVVSQVAMACALSRLEQRAASQARNVAFEQIVWDLVEGPPEHRSAALSRAAELGVTLAGGQRIIRGAFDNIATLMQAHGWDTASAESARRNVLSAMKRSERGAQLRLVSIRGDWIVGVLSTESAVEARAAVKELNVAARSAVPGLEITWGVSSTSRDPLNYTAAHKEAVAALTGARRLNTGEVSLYDELGIVRVLLGSAEGGADLQRFVDDVTAPLRDYDLRHDGALIKTLRAFFDNDCSQRRAAESLFIHPKTLSYRLAQIGDLSGLDLSVHSDRVRADLALRMLQLTESTPESSDGVG